MLFVLSCRDVFRASHATLLPSKKALHIVISSYTLVSNMIDSFARREQIKAQVETHGGLTGDISWDYVILDEGHIIKNPATKLYKSLQMLPTYHRVIMTGTPIQNNLLEFWALVDWVSCGTLLGDKKSFQAQYQTPIINGQNPRVSRRSQLTLLLSPRCYPCCAAHCRPWWRRWRRAKRLSSDCIDSPTPSCCSAKRLTEIMKKCSSCQVGYCPSRWVYRHVFTLLPCCCR